MDWYHDHAQECFSERMTLLCRQAWRCAAAITVIVAEPLGELPLEWDSPP